MKDNLLETYESWICGFSYGIASVFVGQPLDTIKTRMQVQTKTNYNYINIYYKIFYIHMYIQNY